MPRDETSSNPPFLEEIPRAGRDVIEFYQAETDAHDKVIAYIDWMPETRLDEDGRGVDTVGTFVINDQRYGAVRLVPGIKSRFTGVVEPTLIAYYFDDAGRLNKPREVRVSRAGVLMGIVAKSAPVEIADKPLAKEEQLGKDYTVSITYDGGTADPLPHDFSSIVLESGGRLVVKRNFLNIFNLESKGQVVTVTLPTRLDGISDGVSIENGTDGQVRCSVPQGYKNVIHIILGDAADRETRAIAAQKDGISITRNGNIRLVAGQTYSFDPQRDEVKIPARKDPDSDKTLYLHLKLTS